PTWKSCWVSPRAPGPNRRPMSCSMRPRVSSRCRRCRVAGFEFFKTRRTGYIPRTPAAALKAVGTGTVPAEQFIYASASAKPLDEEPFDLEEIERALARPDLNLQSRILLKRVLGKLI